MSKPAKKAKKKSAKTETPAKPDVSGQPKSLADVAKAFTKALKAGDYTKAETFWSDDVVSIENMDGPMKKLVGREAVHGKGQWWYSTHEIHAFKVQGPYLNGDQFALRFKMDVTNKEDGKRVKADEVGVYKVKAGKIVEERFFY